MERATAIMSLARTRNLIELNRVRAPSAAKRRCRTSSS
jgi:hypothetical protein